MTVPACHGGGKCNKSTYTSFTDIWPGAISISCSLRICIKVKNLRPSELSKGLSLGLRIDSRTVPMIWILFVVASNR